MPTLRDAKQALHGRKAGRADMTTTVSVERAMAEAKEVQERGIVGIYPLSLVALAAEVEALRKALQDIASGELGVNLCVKVAQAALAARPGGQG